MARLYNNNNNNNNNNNDNILKNNKSITLKITLKNFTKKYRSHYMLIAFLCKIAFSLYVFVIEILALHRPIIILPRSVIFRFANSQYDLFPLL